MSFSRLGRGLAFLSSFTIQGSFNYRTMIGSGFAFVLLPLLRQIHGRDPAALERAVARHAGSFNSHPYLAGMAAGAVARMESESASDDDVARFKAAVRGPLGGIGDRLVWGRFLPTTLLVAVVLVVAGAPWWWPVLIFLVCYNAGHLALRLWAFRAGLERGRDVAKTLRSAKLGQATERVGRFGSALVGVALGLLFARGFQAGFAGAIWATLLAGVFALGYAKGERASKPATIVAAVIVLGLLLFGAVR